jgi:hypothetical protein
MNNLSGLTIELSTHFAPLHTLYPDPSGLFILVFSAFIRFNNFSAGIIQPTQKIAQLICNEK